MAASNATLAVLFPSNARLSTQAGLTKAGNLPALRFNDSLPEWAEFDIFIARPTGSTVAGYSGTTGIKVNIFWASADKRLAGSVVWNAQIVPAGQTDLPDPSVDLFVSTYEDTATTAAHATIGGGMCKSVISHTIAHIQGAQTTAPAVGDFARLRIRRVADNASDTLVGDALVFGVELQDY